MNTSEYTLDSVGEIVASQRRFFRTGATLPVSWRIHQLKWGFREFTHPQTVLRGSRWSLSGNIPTQARQGKRRCGCFDCSRDKRKRRKKYLYRLRY